MHNFITVYPIYVGIASITQLFYEVSTRVLYERTKQKIGEILRDLCRHRGINILEGHAMSEDDY